MALRTEKDSLGAVQVPADALYGAHTVRALDNFRVSGLTLRDRPELIASLGHVKAAAALANATCGVLDRRIAEVICAAATEVARGEHDDQFPLEVVQGGGGTAINMNANEVIANRAAEILGGIRGRYDLVHPIDHVNRSQSTNDVIPTALAVATVATGQRTICQLGQLETSLVEKARETRGLVRLGRTCLRDAVSLTVEETHLAQAHAVERTCRALSLALDRLLEVPLGATVLGTGIGAPGGYRELALRHLAEQSGLAIRGAENLFDALATADGYLSVAAELNRVMLAASKVAADLRLLSSGPVGGIGEVFLPAVQVGSSIMPGKTNPVIPELVMQIAYEVRGTFAIVEAAVAAGELELNVMEPVIAKHLLGSLRDSGRVAVLFAERCITGLEWNRPVLDAHLAGALDATVELSAKEGYSRVATMMKERLPE